MPYERQAQESERVSGRSVEKKINPLTKWQDVEGEEGSDRVTTQAFEGI
jgi:hypothetical protein